MYNSFASSFGIIWEIVKIISSKSTTRINIGISNKHVPENSWELLILVLMIIWHLLKMYLFFRILFFLKSGSVFLGIVVGITHYPRVVRFCSLFVLLWSNPHIETQKWRWLFIKGRHNTTNRRKRIRWINIPVICDFLFDIPLACEIHMKLSLIVIPMKLNSSLLSMPILHIFSFRTSLSALTFW